MDPRNDDATMRCGSANVMLFVPLDGPPVDVTGSGWVGASLEPDPPTTRLRRGVTGHALAAASTALLSRATGT
jgi:hypothetical protein